MRKSSRKNVGEGVGCPPQSACAHLPRLTPALSPPIKPFPTARLRSAPCRYLISIGLGCPPRNLGQDGGQTAEQQRPLPPRDGPFPPAPAAAAVATAAALTAAASLESPPSRGERRGRGKRPAFPASSLRHTHITAQRGERPIPGQPTAFSFGQRSRPFSK